MENLVMGRVEGSGGGTVSPAFICDEAVAAADRSTPAGSRLGAATLFPAFEKAMTPERVLFHTFP